MLCRHDWVKRGGPRQEGDTFVQTWICTKCKEYQVRDMAHSLVKRKSKQKSHDSVSHTPQPMGDVLIVINGDTIIYALVSLLGALMILWAVFNW